MVDDHIKARRKAMEAEDTSNVDSEDDVPGARPKRKRYSYFTVYYKKLFIVSHTLIFLRSTNFCNN